MEKRKLGKSDLMIVPFVFGGNVFGWTIDEPVSFDLLDAFVDNGFNSIDTASTYSRWKKGNKGGESETIIGNWLKRRGSRDDVLIFTKVGSTTFENTKGLKKDHIISETEKSLKRLDTDYVDLMFSHKDDLSTAPQETLEAYHQLIQQGKVRYIGASNFTPERIEESMKTSLEHNLPEYIAIQPEYNMYDRDFEKTDAEVVKKYDLGVVTYYSLASGFLSGKYKSDEQVEGSARQKSVEKYMNDRGRRMIAQLEKMSAQTGYPIATLALAWILKNPLITAPIASATKISQLNELMKVRELDVSALNFGEFDH